MSKQQSSSGRSQKSLTPKQQSNPNKQKRKKNRAMKASFDRQLHSRARDFPYHPCTKTYLQAAVDPWSLVGTSSMPCIPDLNTTPSGRICLRVRGALTIGTAGVGFIQANARNMVGDIAFGAASGAGFAGTAIGTGGTVGCFALTWSNSPFISTNYAPFGRVVGFGIRIRYTGTELNKGGFSTSFLEVSRGGVGGVAGNVVGLTIPNILVDSRTSTQATTRQWSGITYRSVDSVDFEYEQLIGTASNSQICMMVSGAAGNTYEYDVISYLEYTAYATGGIVSPSANISATSTSASESDVLGFSAVKDFFGKLVFSDFGQSAFQRGIDYIKAKAPAYLMSAASMAAPLLLTL